MGRKTNEKKDFCRQLPKQDRGPVRLRSKKHTVVQQLDLSLELFQYPELGAMLVPTTGRPAPENRHSSYSNDTT